MLISWIAIVMLALSYWFQIWKIHVHREVRDLSLPYHILLASGFGILTYQAYIDDSIVFIIKQIATTIPVLILIGQILYHRQDTWHDEHDRICSCSKELEPAWAWCPYCGKELNI